ncbi:reverse transcriptase domain-containing protein [Tanacetum coccineum]
MSLGEGIKSRLDERSKDWIRELSHVLWAHRTMIKSSNGETPFLLTYGTKAVISAKIGMPTFQTAEVDFTGNDEALKINLDLKEEMRCGRMIKMKSLKRSTMVESKVVEKETVKIGGGNHFTPLALVQDLIPKSFEGPAQRRI